MERKGIKRPSSTYHKFPANVTCQSGFHTNDRDDDIALFWVRSGLASILLDVFEEVPIKFH